MDVLDFYNLRRFVDAQNPLFDLVCAELRDGQKQGHWMWFVFPQLRGLAHSYMSTQYGISGRQEAQAFMNHAILGSRLRLCTRLVTLIEGRSINEIFDYPDDIKFHSSMTLFAKTTCEDQIFHNALQKYFAGKFDQLTIERL